MTIFQPTVTRKGLKTKAKTYSIRYANAGGKQIQENGFLTRDEAAVRLRDARREVKEERAGIRTPKFKQQEKPLAEHLGDFAQTFDDRETSLAQKRLVIGRLAEIFNACGFVSLSDMNSNVFQARLATLRKDGRSQQTCKHLVRHAKQFAKFLLDDDRIEVDPFRKLRSPKVSERCHRRRALTLDECTRLVKAVCTCGPMYGLSGADQEALFLTAMNTGFRASELSRLVVANLHLEADHPHVSLAGSNTKNRDEARIPLRDPVVVRFLKKWIVGKARDELLWPGPWATSRGGSKMMRKALKVAGITYEVDGRKADFHALRYTFITNLINSKENPAYVQRMARHSDINLTFRVYADLGLEDLYHGNQQRNQSSSPRQNGKSRNRSQSAKTNSSEASDDEGDAPISVAQNVAPQVVPECLLASRDVTPEASGKGQETQATGKIHSPQMQQTTGVDTPCRPVSQNVQAERQGFEPWDSSRNLRFSRPVFDWRKPQRVREMRNR